MNVIRRVWRRFVWTCAPPLREALANGFADEYEKDVKVHAMRLFHERNTPPDQGGRQWPKDEFDAEHRRIEAEVRERFPITSWYRSRIVQGNPLLTGRLR